MSSFFPRRGQCCFLCVCGNSRARPVPLSQLELILKDLRNIANNILLSAKRKRLCRQTQRVRPTPARWLANVAGRRPDHEPSAGRSRFFCGCDRDEEALLRCATVVAVVGRVSSHGRWIRVTHHPGK